MADLRREYTAGDLDRQQLKNEPMEQFRAWFDQASAIRHRSRCRKIGIALYKVWLAMADHAPADVNAMTLATVDANGQPSARTVLLKGADQRGFIFFTNYDSRKGRELAQNPRSALTFYWPELERQVCVAGTVTKLSGAESEAYFKSRPRGSQVGAWASNQSTLVESRAVLEKTFAEIEKRFPNDIPIPPNWGGFVLSPSRIEFWQGRASRLHDRFCYTRQSDGTWKIERLSP